ncbi:hypothetical protein Salat_1560200 [Sesamum alatum]|uniref:Myb/SANT-like domain-containing protein n=1 Tax=Sesamum alatum TaxID=300844 RepID=A0AAE1YD28_9LAMI|nr:hypothetical protein Salat_1560200 [Sesamum alatum]
MEATYPVVSSALSKKVSLETRQILEVVVVKLFFWLARLPELSKKEIGEGNRLNSHFNVNRWKNLVTRFNEVTGRNYVYKQLRNYWDFMKKEWILFRKLMQTKTGIGWNPIKNSLDASDEWWEKKIKENGDYSKFRNKDLPLICRDEMLEDNGESNGHEEEHVEIGDSDDIEDIGIARSNINFGKKEASTASNEVMFSSLETIKRK